MQTHHSLGSEVLIECFGIYYQCRLFTDSGDIFVCDGDLQSRPYATFVHARGKLGENIGGTVAVV